MIIYPNFSICTCKHINYKSQINTTSPNTDALAFSGAHFGTGTGDIFLDDVGCSGTESSLLDCSYVSGSNIYCHYGHSEDVSVRCQGKVYNQ